VRFDSLSKRFDIEREIFVKDSTIKRELYVTDSTNNQNLNDLFEVTEMLLAASSNFKSVFAFDVILHNKFDKEIKYVIINCKYKDDYDDVLWDEDIKLKVSNQKDPSWVIRDNYNISKAGYSNLPPFDEKQKKLVKKFTKIKVNYVKFVDDTFVERVNLN
jgi:hypothetical protein